MKDICCIIDECLDKAYLFICEPCPDHCPHECNHCCPPRYPCPPKCPPKCYPYCDPCRNQPYNNQFFKYW